MAARTTEARPALYLRDASLVIISLWIVLIGLRAADLAASETLTALEFVRAAADITFFVAGAWLTIAGIALLIVHHVGERLDLPRALTITGIASVPLTGAGLVVVMLSLCSYLLGVDGPWLTVAIPMILWIGAIIGAPGWYFAHLLSKNTRVHQHTALAISLFLIGIAVLGVVLFSYAWPF